MSLFSALTRHPSPSTPACAASCRSRDKYARQLRTLLYSFVPASQENSVNRRVWSPRNQVLLCLLLYYYRGKYTTECKRADCPNSVCTGYLSDSEEEFCCIRTADLRNACRIPHSVTYEESIHPLPASDTSLSCAPDQRCATLGEEAEDQATSPERPVDIILQQRKELFSLRFLLAAHRQQRDHVLSCQGSLVEALSALDGVTNVDQHVATAPVTRATSTLPSKIDAELGRGAHSIISWKACWESEKPRTLNKVIHDTAPR